MNVNDALDIKIDDALIVDVPFDQTVEFKIEMESTRDDPSLRHSPVPIPDPFNELVASQFE
jgi:hypothetical protein